MSCQRSQRSLLLTPQELGQLKLLIQAHRTPQALARRAQLIEVSHTHPDWGTKQIARALHRPESWVRKWRRRWNETHSLQDAFRSGAPRRFSSEVRAQVTALPTRRSCRATPPPRKKSRIGEDAPTPEIARILCL